MAKSAEASAVRDRHLLMLQQTMDLIAQSRRNVGVIVAALADARQRVEESRALLQRTATAPALPASTRTFAAVDALVARIERRIAHDDPVDGLIAEIQAIIPGDTDPHLLMGILLEGLVQVLLQRVPAPQQRETVVALCTMLCQRMNLIDAGPASGSVGK